MKTSKFAEEQIAYALRLAESGTPVGDVCRQTGVSEATFYVWKKKYAQLGVAELRQFRQLTDENARLKRLVADLTLDKHIGQEVIKKRSQAGAQQRDRALGPRSLQGEHRSILRAGQDHPCQLVLPQPCQGPERLAHAHPRDCQRTASVRP